MKRFSPEEKEKQDKDNLRFYYAPRGKAFKDFIKGLILRGNIKPHYATQLLTEYAMQLYSNAFTSNSITSHVDSLTSKIEEDKESSNNYEMFEKLGDGVFDNFIGWYAFRRFGNVATVNQVKLIHIIRSKYGSKQEFSPIADKLGFWPFISASIYQRNHKRKDLLEDVFEAFLGVTSFILENRFRTGVGYAICYDILASIFDEISISGDFNTLQDFVSKLNELFQRNKDLGKYEFIDERVDNLVKVTIILIKNGKRIATLGTGTASKKQDAKQKAAEVAFRYLESKNYK